MWGDMVLLKVTCAARRERGHLGPTLQAEHPRRARASGRTLAARPGGGRCCGPLRLTEVRGEAVASSEQHAIGQQPEGVLLWLLGGKSAAMRRGRGAGVSWRVLTAARLIHRAAARTGAHRAERRSNALRLHRKVTVKGECWVGERLGGMAARTARRQRAP